MIVCDGVHYLPLPLDRIWTGVAVLEGDPLAFVDTGTAPAAEAMIIPFMAERWPAVLAQEIHVVNTHCHLDHIGGNSLLQRKYGADIACHAADAPFVRSLSLQYRSLYGMFEGFGPLADVTWEAFQQLGGGPSVVGTLFHGGETIGLGGRQFQVLHTPGHTPGSISLYDASDGLLLTGDAVQGDGTSLTGVPLITDFEGYMRSIRLLLDLPAKTLIADHPFLPGEDAILRGEQVNRFLDLSLRVAENHLGRVRDLIARQASVFSLIDLSQAAAEGLGMLHPTSSLVMLVNACLDQLEPETGLHRLSGKRWDPVSRFEFRSST